MSKVQHCPDALDEAGLFGDVKTGDRILFWQVVGLEVNVDSEELRIMKESDMMGIREGQAASMKTA